MATLAKDMGHVKDIQGMMRRSRLATTTEVYMQSLEEGVRSTVNSIYDGWSDTGTWGSNRAAAKSCHSSHEQSATTIAPGRERSVLEKTGSVCEAGSGSGFGICDKIATKSRKEGASK